ncbi:MAG: TIGR02301 family protein [Pseudomonadota bacterium]
MNAWRPKLCIRCRSGRFVTIRQTVLAGVVSAVLVVTPTMAIAQTQAEIDRALSRLSEILGALSHLENICSPQLRSGLSDDQATASEPDARRAQSRRDMEQLLESEELSPLRRSVLIDAYNRGFRTVANTHRRCTSASDRLIGLHHNRGAQIVDQLLDAAQDGAVGGEASDESGATPP